MKSILTAVIIGLSAASSMAGQIYDVTADYQTSSNGSGVWSYGYSPLGGTGYSLVAFDQSNTVAWSMSNYSTLGTPAIWLNTAPYSQYGVAPGQLSLHPGPAAGGDFTLVRFTAPTIGTYKISGQFFAGDGGSMNGSVVLDGNINAPLQYFANTTDGSIFNLNSMKLKKGETIDFAVGNNGSFYSGNTPLSASIQITPVPEPETYAMLLAGLGLIGAAVTRRKAKQA
jgi:hypothetical protein